MWDREVIIHHHAVPDYSDAFIFLKSIVHSYFVSGETLLVCENFFSFFATLAKIGGN